MTMKLVRNALWIATFAVAGLAEAQFTDVTSGDAGNSLFSSNLAWGDCDADGDHDLFVTNWQTGLIVSPNRLLRNDGGAAFVDIAEAAGLGLGFIADGGQTAAAAWADYDNDGDLDLYVVDFTDQDFLFENKLIDGGVQGDEVTFAEIGRAAEINNLSPGSETAVAWGDYDNDGFVDIYLGKFYHDNQLYRNNEGDGSFDRMAGLGVNDGRDAGDVNWVDYDSDGDLDLFVVNRGQQNALYRNDPDPGGFAEVFCALSLANMEIGQRAAWADYDNDLDLDVFVANLGANALYRNEGDDTFVDVSGEGQAGVRHTGASWRTAGAAWSDYDGDGDQDLYLASGRDDSFQGDAQVQPDVLFGNDGDGTFTNVSHLVPAAVRFHMAVGWADYNGDGSPDIYVADGGGRTGAGYVLGYNQLLENSAAAENFIRVRVRRRGGNGETSGDGIGARVYLLNAAGTDTLAYQQVLSTPNAPEVIFGVPDPGLTYQVQVVFPSGTSVGPPATATGGDPIVINEP